MKIVDKSVNVSNLVVLSKQELNQLFTIKKLPAFTISFKCEEVVKFSRHPFDLSSRINSSKPLEKIVASF